MRREVILTALAILALTLITLVGRPTGTDYRQKIVDVSWPQCGTKDKDFFATGIVGVTGGLNFRSNPCAGEQAGWFGYYAIYMNTGFPGGSRGQKFKTSPRHCDANNSLCLAYNYGYNAALYAIDQANRQNVHSNLWWLDVETENSWTDNFLANRQFLRGAMAGVRHEVWFARIGVYSSRTQWNQIMGPWQNKLPVWWATGGKSKAEAIPWCREKGFTGGKVWLTQYTIKYDENYPCSRQFMRHITNEPSLPLPSLKNLKNWYARSNVNNQ